jgi:hypothetical protein
LNISSNKQEILNKSINIKLLISKRNINNI